MKSLKDRVAVVTGAASGIGQATAVALAREGCDVAICDIDSAGLARTAAMVEGCGRKVSVHEVDVSDRARMAVFVDEVIAAHGAVHVLVNNAGVASGASFEDQSIEDFERVMGVNFWGVLYGCKLFLPHLKAQDEAHIVNISSILGLIGIRELGAYCTSKFAVRGFSEVLWMELRDHNIGVTTLHPGFVKTNISRSAVMSAANVESGMAATFTQIMEQRGIEPAKVAAAILKGIRRRRYRVLTNMETYLVDRLKRLAPVAFSVLLAAIIKIGENRMRRSLGS